MVEPRYTLTRDALSLKNRHMVKCYPSFSERENAIKDFLRKLKHYKSLVEKQGNLVDFLTENYEESKEEFSEKLETSCNIRPLTRATFMKRGMDLKNLPKIDSESWMRRTVPDGDRFEYKGRKSEQGLKFESLHESTLYIDHYC